jgi:hypothetical protein
VRRFLLFKRIEISGPEDGHAYEGKDPNGDRDEPTKSEKILEDNN